MWPAGGEQPMAMGRRGPTRSSSAAAPASSSATTTASRQHSPWRQSSPVPYLFGGLAAMLGLIALSLLALACSYWKLAGEPDDAADHQARRAGDGENKGAADGKTTGPAGDKWMEHVVVIMAGDEGPTLLATPASRRREEDGDAAASGARGGGSDSEEQGRCVECGARARPVVAGVEDDNALNRSESEQSAATGSRSSGT